MIFKKLEDLFSLTEEIKRIYLSIFLCEKTSTNCDELKNKLTKKLELEKEMYDSLNYTEEELIEIISVIESTYKIDKYTTIPELIIKSDNNGVAYRIYFRLLDRIHKVSVIEILDNYFKMDDINLFLHLIEVFIKSDKNEIDKDKLLNIKYIMALLFPLTEEYLLLNEFLVSDIILTKTKYYANVFNFSNSAYEKIKENYHLKESNNLFNTFILMCLSDFYTDEDFFIFCIFFKTVITSLDPQILENFKIRISNLHKHIGMSKFFLIIKTINTPVSIDTIKPIALIKDNTK
ncbi:MAG: hypothetical protein RR189_00645 [Bacilli bacterium]